MPRKNTHVIEGVKVAGYKIGIYFIFRNYTPKKQGIVHYSYYPDLWTLYNTETRQIEKTSRQFLELTRLAVDNTDGKA